MQPSRSGTDPGGAGESPALIAHRGFAGAYPENTVTAVTSAVAGDDGAEMVEVDVYPTADGELVVFHDPTPGRLTDAADDLADRNVWDLPYDVLADLEVLGSGETVPRLDDVLAALPPTLSVNVELKNPGITDARLLADVGEAARSRRRRRWETFADRLARVVDGHAQDVLVSSSFEGALAATSEVAPDLDLAYLFWDSVEDGLAVTRRYDCEALHPPRNMIAGTDLFNADYYTPGGYDRVDLVDLAHEEGRTVNVWTVETWYQAAQLARAGVDGIVADHPTVLAAGGAAERSARHA